MMRQQDAIGNQASNKFTAHRELCHYDSGRRNTNSQTGRAQMTQSLTKEQLCSLPLTMPLTLPHLGFGTPPFSSHGGGSPSVAEWG